MYKFSIKNEKGEMLHLSKNKNYRITNISGLHPVSANINTFKTVGVDGSKFNSSNINDRNMTIDLAIPYEAEKNRIALYRFIKPKSKVKIYYENDYRNVWIEAYVEDMTVDYFTNVQEVQIVLICLQPFFKDAQEMIYEMSAVIDDFEFEFSNEEGEAFTFGHYDELVEMNVPNEGDVKTGMTIHLIATGKVVNPKILNRDTREFFALNYTMESGESIIITTNTGNKKITSLKKAKETNIFNHIQKSSSWFQLDFGDNLFTYEADAGIDYLQVRFIHVDEYEGV